MNLKKGIDIRVQMVYIIIKERQLRKVTRR